MTAESGEIWCAWRRTSTPSTFGILMSVTITSKSALSILRLAASPPVTVSTLWPSRRRAISSSSQMERSSSQTRMLPTRSSCCCDGPGCALGCGPVWGRGGSRGCRHGGNGFFHPPQTQHERSAFADFRTGPDLAVVRLHNLVHDGQTESGATFKVGLEGLEDLLRLLRIDAGAGIGEAHLPIRTALHEADGERAAVFLHGANRILAKIPEHLLELVAVGQSPRSEERRVGK